MTVQSTRGAELAAAAAALAGAPFRLHGRDPTIGLDCIGLLEAALAVTGHAISLPRGYSLRNSDMSGLLPAPGALGFAPAIGAALCGDVVMTQPGPAQFHLAIALADGAFVHAHAGLRRVVIQPGPLSGAVIAHWRLLPAA